MALRFPDAASFTAALRDGLVPPELAGRPVPGAAEPGGAVWVDAAGLNTIPAGAERRPDVQRALTEACCWAELIAPVRVRATSPTTVLFHVPTTADLARLVAELRRLECPGVGFTTHGRGRHTAHLVRVSQPPDHVLARRGSVIPFVERGPHVWVEYGYGHPLADTIHPPRGRRYLIPATGAWLNVPNAPFPPADARPTWAIGPCRPRLSGTAALASVVVPCRLRDDEPTDGAELWVLAGPAIDRLHQFVAQADGRLVEVLDVAVAPEGTVALRARGSRTGPPVVSLGAMPYVPLLKLPNVYQPAGSRLRPPVRRDVLRERLCRPDRVTWLSPTVKGRFEVVSVPANGFRPLAEWVEYAVPPATPRPTWRPTTTLFVPETFTVPAEPARPPTRGSRRGQGAVPIETPPAVSPLPVARGQAPGKSVGPPQAEEPTELEVLPASEAVERLHELEATFLATDGPLDAPERRALWGPFAELAAAAGQDEDAAIGWANALWLADSPRLGSRWARSERAPVGDPAKALDAGEPQIDQLRSLAAWVIGAAAQPNNWPGVSNRLPAVVRMLEEHDLRLPVRIAWLAWVAIARLSGGDVLGLTRARDRLLRDLFENGLRRDRDFPTFLRGAANSSPGTGPDLPLFRLRERAWDWCRGASGGAILRVFVDLTFAYALARFGDVNGARALLEDVGQPDDAATERRKHRPAPQAVEPYQGWFWAAYQERVRRQFSGESPTAPLSADLRRRLDGLAREHGRTAGPEQRAAAQRFLQFSRILEPFSRVDPFRQGRPDDDLGRALTELAAFTVPARKRDKVGEQIEARVRDLMKTTSVGRPRLRVLAVAVPTAVRVGESLALECVAHIRPTLAAAGRWLDAADLVERVNLLETAVGVAAHFGRPHRIGGLLEELHHLLEDVGSEVAAWVVAALGPGSFRFLCRLGLAGPARTLLDRMAEAVTGGQTVGKLVNRPGLNRGIVYPALLRLAAGWFYFGEDGPARQALRAARAELFDPATGHDPRNRLAEAYATALGHAPVEEALAGFREIFDRLPVTGVEPHGTIHRLRVIEAVALATAAEDFTADVRSRRWLDEDEFLVRQRIHRDVEAALSGS